MKILLVEPDYPNKYPPLGLLKIGAYHQQRGDEVVLYKGLLKGEAAQYFDRIYITTLFSFYYSKTIATILHYKRMVGGNLRRLYVGGIYATLYPQKIYAATGIYPFTGQLNRPGILGDDKVIVDQLAPAYDLLDSVNYDYALKDAYFGYATRGCPNTCAFCAVPKLEPKFIDYIDIKPFVNAVREQYGEKSHLVLMDNNVLASKRFGKIIADIKQLGFARGAKLQRRQRTVDFNQGLDASLVTTQNAALLAEICIKPVRLAYDGVRDAAGFERAIKRLSKAGLKGFSTYVLYNFYDTPADLYFRLDHTTRLSEEIGCQIYSFPMRYTPLDAIDRLHVGKNWTMRRIRGLQKILNYAKGVVSSRRDLFFAAFGKSANEFEEIIHMPDEYILQRNAHKGNGASEWRRDYRKLTAGQRQTLWDVLADNKMDKIIEVWESTKDKRLKRLLQHHIDYPMGAGA